jgi:hypothetical protein
MQHPYIALARRGYKPEWNHGCTQINTDKNWIERNKKGIAENTVKNDADRN